MNDQTGETQSTVDAAPPKALASGTSATTQHENVPRGIVMMVVATFLFSSASAASKWLVGIYPLGETIFLRSFSSLLTAAAIILPVSGLSVYATKRPRDHIFRGMSQTISQVSLLLAFSLMPLAGATAISFAAPLFAAVVSIFWLGERAGWVRGSALLIGFGGVLIVTNPGANSLTLGAMFALINAVMYGTVTIAVRGMARTESANTLVIWQLSVLSFFHAFLLLLGWRWPTPLHAALMFGTGFVNAIGQWCWTRSLHLAPAAAVTPFYYLMLVWSIGIGYLVWGEIPTVSLLAGSAIVVATGLFLFLREARLQRRPIRS